MGITFLEENVQHIRKGYPALTPYLDQCAARASCIQIEMRSIFDRITPQLCSPCQSKCCEGFPLEGWFSLEDYLLFRTKYPKPPLPPDGINHPRACSFATPGGCSLPTDLRPFTCVKINCATIAQAIKDLGEEAHFTTLVTALDTLYREVSLTLKQHQGSLHHEHCDPPGYKA